MKIKEKLKMKLSIVSIFVLFITYFIVTDPDSKLIQNLPFGSDLVLILGIFVISISAILFIESVPDFYIDYIYGDERETKLKAMEDPIGASIVMLSKSVRILGYAIIIAYSISALTVS